MIYKLGASMIIPTICLQKANFSVHPFGADDFLRYEDLAKEIYQILSDEETLYFIPEKRLVNIEDAKNWLNGAILNFHNGRNAVHFITSNSTGKLVGIIDLIPPAVAREHYRLEDYPYFLEFYLIGDAKGQSIMTNLLPAIVKNLRSNGIKKIAAVVNRKNHAAGKVLERSGFILRNNFDPFQDLYALSA
ncbi:ribosomal-protein-alanine N-acetyltransferase [Mucilaginibacter lappiensis]